MTESVVPGLVAAAAFGLTYLMCIRPMRVVVNRYRPRSRRTGMRVDDNLLARSPHQIRR